MNSSVDDSHMKPQSTPPCTDLPQGEGLFWMLGFAKNSSLGLAVMGHHHRRGQMASSRYSLLKSVLRLPPLAQSVEV